MRFILGYGYNEVSQLTVEEKKLILSLLEYCKTSPHLCISESMFYERGDIILE